jgi:hypothetical protein
MSWESLLKVGGGSRIPSNIRAPAFRKAIMDAAMNAGAQFTLREIHEPFLENYTNELVNAGLAPRHAAKAAGKYRTFSSFYPLAGRYFKLIGRERTSEGELTFYEIKR